jgi:predicted phage gp36 major capsid-like protein
MWSRWWSKWREPSILLSLAGALLAIIMAAVQLRADVRTASRLIAEQQTRIEAIDAEGSRALRADVKELRVHIEWIRAILERLEARRRAQEANTAVPMEERHE